MLEKLRHILAVRRWERQSLPFLTPQIALDVMLLAAVARLEGEARPVKSFHLVLDYSEDRTREVIQNLAADGYLTIESCEWDRRSRMIVASDCLVDLMAEYIRVLEHGSARAGAVNGSFGVEHAGLDNRAVQFR